MRWIAILLAGVTLAACDRAGPASAPDTGAEAAATGEPMVKGVSRAQAGSPIPAIALDDPKGARTPLSQAAAGRPVLVNLWATWCAPCVKELPTLQALAARAGAPRVVAVSQDMGPRGSIDAFLARSKLSDLEVWHDKDMALSDALQAQILPTTVLYGADGKEVWRYTGDLDWTGTEAASLLAEAAGAPAP